MFLLSGQNFWGINSIYSRGAGGTFLFLEIKTLKNLKAGNAGSHHSVENEFCHRIQHEILFTIVWFHKNRSISCLMVQWLYGGWCAEAIA